MKATEKQKGYMRKYYQKNKGKISQIRKSHHQENKERRKELARNYFNSHRDLVLKHQVGYRVKYNLKKKIEVLSFYSDGSLQCKSCGFNDLRALSIDHINGGGSRHREIMKGDTYGWLRRNNFPDGYQVLCMNCQWIKRQVNRECYKG